MTESYASFTGSIPEIYDRHLGPVLCEPYARDLARRASDRFTGRRVLETACGTGILTRQLDAALPPPAAIVATDLNEGMLAIARRGAPLRRAVEWRTADAAALSFEPGTFDAVVCQFGMMFVPDKLAAAREARRVLATGGRFVFNVWDRIEENSFARVAHATVASFFEAEPPKFYEIPFGFHDVDRIRRMLADAGFTDVRVERVSLTVQAESAAFLAKGLVEGNPVADAIREARLPFEKIIDAVTSALAREGGAAPFRSKTAALAVVARA
jgi:ubiquinone/menaquinone biosynthesis C-methylase UbiE